MKKLPTLFSPAIALLNRMGYTKKFTLLWLASLVAIAVVVYSLFVSLDLIIRPSQRELEGVVLIEPISRTVQFIQKHRVFSAELLGGNEAMKGKMAGKMAGKYLFSKPVPIEEFDKLIAQQA